MKVGVIMGGISSEREVSLKTGEVILAHLDREKYDVKPIAITKREELIDKVKGIDIALLALHGSYGEDGTVQGALETLGIPYTGSGVLSSSICMDKDLSKKLLRAEGISTPDWVCWNSIEEYDPEAIGRMGYPVIVKPNSGGSSIGTELVTDENALHKAVQEAFRWDESVMIESYIKGEEITCSILDGELLPIIGIRSAQSEWFDYQAKYVDGGAEEQVITLPTKLDERVRSMAMNCFKVLKCSVYGRVDMMIRDGIPYVLEVNTLPGMTTNSLLPKSAKAAGIPFSELLDRIIACSWEERTKKRGEMNNVE
ncbi:D-alanine--D-alanine ligase [Paenibacillus dakarensis]|uniref:D-alanine--D-alanine ligase n=1 Tax=Paenibacillus dakarensis TaxID=1527293 RepID=UPI0006D52C2C|nr:D-alanine--D-alanine ligase [Paenibacillus dakarensis]